MFATAMTGIGEWIYKSARERERERESERERERAGQQNKYTPPAAGSTLLVRSSCVETWNQGWQLSVLFLVFVASVCWFLQTRFDTSRVMKHGKGVYPNHVYGQRRKGHVFILGRVSH